MSRAVVRLMRVPAALLLVSACGAAPGPGPETAAYSCEYAILERGSSGSATIEVQGDEVVKVSVFVFYTGLPGRLGYSCTLEAGRNDPAADWTRHGSVTEIAFSGDSPGLDDLVVITESDLEFVIEHLLVVVPDAGRLHELPREGPPARRGEALRVPEAALGNLTADCQ